MKAAAKVKEEHTLARAAAKKIKAAERAAAKAKAEEEQEAEEEEEEEEEDYLTTWRDLSAIGWTYARGSFLSSVSGQPSDYVWLRPGRKKENIGSTNCIENRDYFFDEKSVLAFVKVSWAINTTLSRHRRYLHTRVGPSNAHCPRPHHAHGRAHADQ